MRNRIFLLAAGIFCLMPSFGRADVIVFDHNFDNGTNGSVTAIGGMGSPTVGTIAFENPVTATYGWLSTATDKAFTTGNDALTRNTIPAAQGPLNTAFAADPGGNFGTSAATNRLYANFASTDITGGNSVSVNFDIGGFGTQNSGAFKAMTVRGLSSAGDEVFEAWVGFGSGNATRFIYAREAADTTYLRTTNTAGTPAGTRIYSNIPNNGYIGTNNTVKPTGLDTLSISVVNGIVTYGFADGTAGGTLSFGQNSAATDLAQLEFTSVNFNQGGNSGYWLDNIVVDATAVPEPASMGVLALGLFGLFARRRR